MVDLNNKNILITGGCGFIGSNFIEYINKHYSNMTIINIDKYGIGHRILTGTILNKNSNYYREFNMNITHMDSSTSFLNNGTLNSIDFDYVFHFAAESHVDRSITNPSTFVYNNSYGTSVLLEYLNNRKSKARIICISTDEVYGHLNLNDPAFTEETSLDPRSPYSASKAASDLIALAFNKTFGMDIIVTRCCNNYGPNQYKEKFIPTIINKLMDGQKIPVYGSGTNIREWIHVDDHNKSILEIAKDGESGMIYNIGSGVEKTNLELIKLIVDILKDFGYAVPDDSIEFVQDRKGHDFRYAIDTLNYKRNFKLLDFEESLRETVKFYIQKFIENKNYL